MVRGVREFISLICKGNNDAADRSEIHILVWRLDQSSRLHRRLWRRACARDDSAIRTVGAVDCRRDRAGQWYHPDYVDRHLVEQSRAADRASEIEIRAGRIPANPA